MDLFCEKLYAVTLITTTDLIFDFIAGTHRIDLILFSEAGAIPNQVPLRRLRVRERGRCYDRHWVQAKIHARQRRLLGPNNVRSLGML